MRLLPAEKLAHYARIYGLYRRAFPRNERKPFSVIRRMSRRGKTDIWYFEDGQGFLGLATTINGDGLIHIDYFAVSEKRRGQGHGRKMLKALLDRYSPSGVFLEIEIPDENAENFAERLRRKRFYLGSGLAPMNTRASLFGVGMELLGVDCHLDFNEYRNFYLQNYGKFAYDNIRPIE